MTLITKTVLLSIWLLMHLADANDDSVRRALNEIAYRQRQLASPYYTSSDNDNGQSEQSDDRLMFLDALPLRDTGDDRQFAYPKSRLPSDSLDFSGAEEEDDSSVENDVNGEKERYLKNRLLERLLLDYLLNDEESLTYPRQTKRSFFRERTETPETLQSLFDDDGEFAEKENPSSFRERSKDVQREKTIGRLIDSAAEADRDSYAPDDYMLALNSVWEKYKGNYLDRNDADQDSLTDEDIEDFLRYLNEKDGRNKNDKQIIDYYSSEEPEFLSSAAIPFDQRQLTGDAVDSGIDYLRKNPAVVEQLRPVYGKRYWLGSEEKLPYNNYVLADNKEIKIKKRSPSSAMYTSHRNYNKTGGESSTADGGTKRKENLTEAPPKQSQTNGSSTVVPPVLVEKDLKLNKTQKKWKEFKKTRNGKPIWGESSGAGKTARSTKKDLSKENPDKTSGVSDRPLKIVKKSVDWSTYFGVDKRQQYSNNRPSKGTKQQQQQQQSDILNHYIQAYIRQSIRDSAFNPETTARRKNAKRSSKLSTVDEDLKAAEDAVIDNVLKYTGAHEGITDPKEVEKFKQTVIGQLAAAYNLEKLRKAFRRQNYIEQEEDDGSIAYDDEPDDQVAARGSAGPLSRHYSQDSVPKSAATKKEKSDLKHEPEKTFGTNRKTNLSANHNKNSTSKANKFMNGNESSQKHLSAAGSHHGNKKKSAIFSNEIEDIDCPVLNDVIKKCYEIVSLTGDRDNVFLPFCVIHQICYICGANNKDYEESCDINFISGSVAFCGEAPLCQYTARRIMQTMYGLRKRFDVDTCDSCLPASLQKLFAQ